jgi:hypothetical protein
MGDLGKARDEAFNSGLPILWAAAYNKVVKRFVNAPGSDGMAVRGERGGLMVRLWRGFSGAGG